VGEKVTARRKTWVAWLWLFILIWGGYLGLRAFGELRGGTVVKGLFRSYSPPYLLPEGRVVDPRATSLFAELRQRYRPDVPVDEAQISQSPDPWNALAKILKLGPRAADPQSPVTMPSLLYRELGKVPDLWVRHYGEHHVVFRAGVGVLLMEKIPASQRVITLTNSSDNPW